MPHASLTRRSVVKGAAGVVAGLAGATLGTPGLAWSHDHDGQRLPVPPKPIPGGLEVAPGQVIHVWGPGPADVTLPFSGGPLQGLDVEPTTIRDFDGFAAVAFHVGRARGDDGTEYDLETDVRAFQGTYIDRTGRRRFGTFGFI